MLNTYGTGTNEAIAKIPTTPALHRRTSPTFTLLRSVCRTHSTLSSKVIMVVATRIPLQLGTTTVTKKEPLCYPMTYDVT